MAKYIHKQAAIHALVNEANIHNNPIKRAYTRAAAIIEQITAEDVQPVKHGYWKEEEPRVLKCSVCGEYAPMNYLGQNCIDSRYCPWCGTKMDSNADEPWQSD